MTSCEAACAASSARVVMPSFAKIWDRCTLTVPEAMNSRRAMASFRRPSLTRRTTSSSAGVRLASQEAVDQLSEADLAAWLRTLPHRGKAPRPGQLHARLQAAARGTAGADGTARAPVTGALAATLSTLTAQIKALEADIGAQLAAHPDARIFTSLPRAGTVRAARLLAETGDCRARFPGPESLAALAGVAPVTRQSGKHTSAGFRWAVNRQLRDAVLRLRRRLPARQPLGRGPLRRRPAPAARTTRTPCASWPAPGST